MAQRFGFSRFTRRAFARSSATEIAAVSSMTSSLACHSEIECCMCFISSRESLPPLDWMRCLLTPLRA